MTEQPAIVILSGGIDSTTLLHFLAKDNRELYGLSFFYGQRHKKELEFAQILGGKNLSTVATNRYFFHATDRRPFGIAQ